MAFRLVKDDDVVAQLDKWCGVEVEGTIKMFLGRHLGGKDWLPQEVQRELCLCWKLVTVVVEEGVRYFCKDGEEVRLEGVDGAFSHIAMVQDWGHTLELLAPLLSDDKLIGDAGLVVKHLEVDRVTAKLETLNDVVVGCDTVAVVVGLKGFDHDHVTVGVVRQHDVVVALTRAAGELSHVVGVDLADGLNNGKELFGALIRDLIGDIGEGNICGRLGLGGAGTLS